MIDRGCLLDSYQEVVVLDNSTLDVSIQKILIDFVAKSITILLSFIHEIKILCKEAPILSLQKAIIG